MKVGNGGISFSSIVQGSDNELIQYSKYDNIRPIVYLKTNLQTTGQDENGAWVISEE